MTEATDTAPEAKPRSFIPKEVLNQLVNAITTELHEPNRALIQRIVLVVGVERAQALLQQTLAIEAADGQMTRDGTRRKTPGGVFISLARAQATDAKERGKLLDTRRKNKLRPNQGTDQPPTTPKPPAAPVPDFTWSEALPFVAQATQAVGEAKTVKLTLIGRPDKVIQQPSCVVVAMKGKAPPALPKGLPIPPANSAATWAVFIVNKQWEKVKESIKQTDDQLILEGYPIVDTKRGANVLLVSSCKSVMQERAQRAAKQTK